MKFYKIHLLLLITATIISCTNKSSDISNTNSTYQIVSEKYLESIARTEYFLSINRNIKKQDPIFKLIDSIESQIDIGILSKELKNKIIQDFDTLKRTNTDPEVIKRMVNYKDKFKKNNQIEIQDLDFIDKYLEIRILAKWNDRYSAIKVESLISSDTMYLIENKKYKLPIRLSYSDLPETSMQIISNSLQDEDPYNIVFRTNDHETKRQTVKYSCEVINRITEVKKTLEKSVVINLVKKER